MSIATAAVQIAKAQRGKTYVYGAAGPDTFDCSGLVWYAYFHAGLPIPRVSTAGMMRLPGMVDVPLSKLQPGDLLFYGDPVHHVAISLGGNRILHAPHTGSVVSESTITGPGKPIAARRFSAAATAVEGGGLFLALAVLVAVGVWATRKPKAPPIS